MPRGKPHHIRRNGLICWHHYNTNQSRAQEEWIFSFRSLEKAYDFSNNSFFHKNIIENIIVFFDNVLQY